MKTGTLIAIILLGLLLIGGLAGVGLLCVTVRTSASPAGAYPLEFGAGAPGVSKDFVRALLLTPEQTAAVNESLAVLDRDYLAEEAKHVTKRTDAQGHVHVSIGPFAGEVRALQDEFWSTVDKALDERQRAMAREHLALREVRPYGDVQATIELWRSGPTYHSKEATKGLFSRGSASGSGPTLSRRYARFWGDGRKTVSSAPADGKPVQPDR